VYLRKRLPAITATAMPHYSFFPAIELNGMGPN